MSCVGYKIGLCGAGFDEAGTSAWAGPVVAAAVASTRGLLIDPLDGDSKALPAVRRAAIVDRITRQTGLKYAMYAS